MTTWVYDNPDGTGFRIERLWAFLAIHGDGDEGVIALNNMPMVAADEARVTSLRPMVQQFVNNMPPAVAKPVMLTRFDRRTDFGLIVPE